jgi:hypothetical protein
LSIHNELFFVRKVWIWSLRLNVAINFRSRSQELNESFEIISIWMLRSPKTIVGHEVGAIMMNSCNIFKFCKWGKMRFIQRKTCMAFLVLGLKVATINYYSICVIVLCNYKITLFLYIIRLPCLSKRYIWSYFVLRKHLRCFFNFLFFEDVTCGIF